jgi:hypothetical protein
VYLDPGGERFSFPVPGSVCQHAAARLESRGTLDNSLFIGTSNQLGEFESGVTASWFGIIPATIIGGVGSVVVALIWMGLFPGLRKLESVATSATEETAQVVK